MFLKMTKQWIVAPKTRFLLLLIVADLIFIILYGLYGLKVLDDPKLGLIEDWSYGEVFQYTKEIWIIALLPFLAIRHKTARFVVWIATFLYLLLDDSCQLHERAGLWLSQWLDLPAWGAFRSQDSGELLFAMTVGACLVSAIAMSFIGASRAYRGIAGRLLGLLFALAFFGVFVDLLQFESSWLIEKSIGAIEDGGEQIVMSLITWYVYLHSIETEIPPEGQIQGGDLLSSS